MRSGLLLLALAAAAIAADPTAASAAILNGRQTAPVRVDTQVPVAGTWITQPMYGKWCARV